MRVWKSESDHESRASLLRRSRAYGYCGYRELRKAKGGSPPQNRASRDNDRIVQDPLRGQIQDKESSRNTRRNSSGLGDCRIASDMEGRAATLSTALGVGDLRQFARRTKRGVGVPSRRQKKHGNRQPENKGPTITSLTNEMLEMVPSAM
jgi:hypothetical protein